MNPLARTAYQRWMVPALRIIIGGVFIFAGQAKVGNPAAFADRVASFRLLPTALDNLMAMGLPTFEILLGFLLIVGWFRRTPACCVLVASGVFLAALVSAWIRHIPVDCGCFGGQATAAGPGTHRWLTLGRDVLLFAGAAVVYANAWQRQEVRRA